MSRVLVVSGASQGIGLAAAKRFQDQGYRVVNLSRRQCPLAGVDNIAIDLAQPGAVEQHAEALAQAVAEAEQVVLLHNAARQEFDRVDNLAEANLQAVLQINVVAPQSLNLHLIPHMPPGSAILYIGSTLSEKAVPGTCSYVTSKHAVIGLMRATVQDLAGKGIHSACICPGFTDTEMLRSQIGGRQEVIDGITAMVTQGRLIDVEEIADSIWYCASSPVINGAILHANLGQLER
ncbi:SDR family oxidoreductase [Spongiibacter taiwanensis]|uniref:SDR family NAD(P)-dependent oxidoreductase n=1 Tax=Spongiibacter taiwanensis TaxID=1748242 RepID=UPI0020359019|nr:SDR family oxidoreductase [Spongiibacter taiwanensis]USA42543.1 SDR family oxidoreductase [Spongiibacter taiwanensis]